MLSQGSERSEPDLSLQKGVEPCSFTASSNADLASPTGIRPEERLEVTLDTQKEATRTATSSGPMSAPLFSSTGPRRGVQSFANSAPIPFSKLNTQRRQMSAINFRPMKRALSSSSSSYSVDLNVCERRSSDPPKMGASPPTQTDSAFSSLTEHGSQREDSEEQTAAGPASDTHAFSGPPTEQNGNDDSLKPIESARDDQIVDGCGSCSDSSTPSGGTSDDQQPLAEGSEASGKCSGDNSSHCDQQSSTGVHGRKDSEIENNGNREDLAESCTIPETDHAVNGSVEEHECEAIQNVLSESNDRDQTAVTDEKPRNEGCQENESVVSNDQETKESEGNTPQEDQCEVDSSQTDPMNELAKDDRTEESEPNYSKVQENKFEGNTLPDGRYETDNIQTLNVGEQSEDNKCHDNGLETGTNQTIRVDHSQDSDKNRTTIHPEPEKESNKIRTVDAEQQVSSTDSPLTPTQSFNTITTTTPDASDISNHVVHLPEHSAGRTLVFTSAQLTDHGHQDTPVTNDNEPTVEVTYL